MVAVKGMKIPERCEECNFCMKQGTSDYGSFGECLLQEDKRINCLAWSRDDNCPLVEVATCKDCKSIKVLDKEPCEDAISRKAMLDYQQYLHGRMPNEENYKLWEFIKNLPSVMPKAESCEDAVSREAVLAIAGDSCLDLDSYEDTKEFCDEVKELPSVAHTQKTGRWIFVDDAHEHACCSECGYGNVDLFNGRPHNYCPNCGSFMMDNERTLEYANQDVMMSAT